MILSWYIIRQQIGPFLFGLSLIVFIFTMNLVFQMLSRIAGKGIPIPIILEYFIFNLAWILALAVPMTVLIAALSSFGRMSGDGEISALRASGISPWRLVMPALWWGLVITLFVAWFNNNVLPDMNHRAKLLLSDISRKKPTLNIEPGVYNFSIPNLALLANSVNQDNGGLGNITIYDERNPERRAVITAVSGRLKFIEDQEVVKLILFDGEIHRPSIREDNAWEWTQFDSAVFRVETPGLVLKQSEEGYRGDRELSAQDMWVKVKELRERDAEGNNRRIDAFMVEIHKKMSIPAACLVFILLGAPLGILAHKGGIGVSGGMSLLFFTIYWAFLINGEDLAERDFITPATAMWSPNILFFMVGVWLMWLAGRRTSLPLSGWVSELILKIRILFEGRTTK